MDFDNYYRAAAWPDLPAAPPEGLESEEQATERDREGAKALRRSRLPGAAALAAIIDPGEFPFRYPKTLASARYFRTVQEQFVHELGGLCYYESDGGDMRLITINPPGWAVRVGELGSFPLESKLRVVRGHLNKVGVSPLPGPMVAVVGGEFDATLGLFQLHLNVVATAATATLIGSRLPGLPAYRANSYVHEPVRVMPFDVDGENGAVTHLLKHQWRIHYRRWSARSGERAPGKREHQLMPRLLAEVLLWLNPRPVGDLIFSSNVKLRRHVSRL